MNQVKALALVRTFLDTLTQAEERQTRFACFGSRETPLDVLSFMEQLGRTITDFGGFVRSGHARGADQAFERGADPERLTKCLPWPNYNREDPPFGGASEVLFLTSSVEAEAAQHHPAWPRLSRGAKLLHCRNMLIAENAAFGICYLNHAKPGGGGSGQCWRALTSRGVPVADLSDTNVFLAFSSFFYKG